MKSEEFIKARDTQAKLDSLTTGWLTATTLLNNNRPHDALELVTDLMPVVDELGDAFTISQYPHCLGCDPPGSAEVRHPTEPQKKLVCYLDSGDVGGKPHCRGNQLGRMHPVQLREFIEAVIAGRAPKGPDAEPVPTPVQAPPCTDCEFIQATAAEGEVRLCPEHGKDPGLRPTS